TRVRALMAAGKQQAEVWCEVMQDPVYDQLLKRSAARRCKPSRNGQGRPYTEEDIASEATRILLERNRAESPFPWKPVGKLDRWLATVLARACGEARRRLAHRQRVIPFSELADGGKNIPQPDQAERERWVHLREAIINLDDPYRTVMWLRMVDGF